MSSKITIRAMQQGDLSAVVAIQDSCYSEALFESPDLVAMRLGSHPNWCLVAQSDLADGSQKVVAYLFSYPSMDGKVARLGSTFAQYSAADVLYLHDMAVRDEARGLGLAQRLLEHAQAQAQNHGLKRISLVAVQGSVTYWQRHGFNVKAVNDKDALLALKSYTGQDAVYMQKHLPEL